MSTFEAVVFVVVVVAAVVFYVYRAIRVVPQATAAVIERFGRYKRTLEPGLRFLVPGADRVRATVDLREQVMPFPPQEVITEDNLLVYIDWVVYFQVIDPRRATYEIQNFVQAIEYLVSTTLRNIIGGMDLEATLTSRDEVNRQLRDVLDSETGRWGIRVSRVELRTIQPNRDITEAMEKQVRAERERRATILSAEGVKQAEILRAEGERQSMILKAEGEAKAAALRADGEASAISKTFKAIHDGNADQKLLSYQYLQMLPKIADGNASKLWIVPSELGKAVEGIGNAFSNATGGGGGLPASPLSAAPPEVEDGEQAAALPPAQRSGPPAAPAPADRPSGRRNSPNDVLFRRDE
ncbi:SPFH domain-containing protein [Actinospica robiniae]|uniref:SPFH domain-containing protein n=1 Tax=Actinospica robiniae TaxID=304901 RepID=UPI000415B750|nr:SPFH domain-containing protein [Actinospica robiniae]